MPGQLALHLLERLQVVDRLAAQGAGHQLRVDVLGGCNPKGYESLQQMPPQVGVYLEAFERPFSGEQTVEFRRVLWTSDRHRPCPRLPRSGRW